MSAILRDAPLGQIIRYFSGSKLFEYPEEQEDFDCPEAYSRSKSVSASSNDRDYEKPEIAIEQPATPVEPTIEEGRVFEEVEDSRHAKRGTYDVDAGGGMVDLHKIDTVKHERGHRLEGLHSVRSTRSTTGAERIGTRTVLQRSNTQADLEAAFTAASKPRGFEEPIAPEVLENGTILVDWYSTDDQENPQNWSTRKKAFVTFQICAYTMAVYIGSAIYTPSAAGIMEDFGVSQQAASLGLSMYVLAYGVGPMLWSPLSELPSIGRNPPYMATFAIFVILLVPTALASNFDGFIALRFLLGFFGSPCLATGGASLQDLWDIFMLPYMMSFWATSATLGPSLGPVISGFSVPAENWRWSQWEILWLAGPIWLLMFFCLPETSSDNILLRRAKRLRKLTGDDRLKAASEIAQENFKVSQLVVDSFWRPIEVMILDPSVGFAAVYTALIYGIYYSFFEVFPIVYLGYYGFNVGEMGLTFLAIPVGVVFSLAFLWSYNYWYANPYMLKNGFGEPERRLIPALGAALFCPTGLFIYGWTSNPDIHWIVPCIGISIFTIGIFIMIQCIFLYLPFSYPKYAASIFAGNDFARSSLAAGAIHFSSPLFNNLGVGVGCSILGALMGACVFGVYGLYFFGAKLRARSRFSAM